MRKKLQKCGIIITVQPRTKGTTVDTSSLTPKKMRKSKNGKQGTRYYDADSRIVAKTCATCDEVKYVHEFAPAKAQNDGLFSKCRPCASEYQKSYRATGPLKPNTLGREQYAERTDEDIRKILEERYPRGTRPCTACGVTYPLDLFYINKSNPSIVSSRCKECAKEAASRRTRTLASDDPEYYSALYNKYRKQALERSAEELQSAREEAYPKGVKTCSKCHIERPLHRYNVVPSAKNATASVCSDCRNMRRSVHLRERRKTQTQEQILRVQKEKYPNNNKVCRKCKDEKPLEEFRLDRGQLDGLRRECALCSNESRNQLRKKAYEDYWRANNIPFECYICQGPYEHSDHVIPEVLGGSDGPHNRLPMCSYHNGSKNGTPLEQWLGVFHPDNKDAILHRVVDTYKIEVRPQ